MAQLDVLVCGHKVQRKDSKFPLPQPGILVWCVYCNKQSHMPFPLKLDDDGFPILGEWGWLCRSGCGRGNTGQDQTAAVRAGTRHYQFNPGHEIWLISPIGAVEGRWNYQGEMFG